MTDKLNPGDSLLVGASVTSRSGQFTLIMQTDGNLVLYSGGQPRWASGTGTPGSTAIMQTDGNFVVYAPQGAVWVSKTAGHPGASLIVQDDGNVVIYDPGGHPLWASEDSKVQAQLDSDLGAGHFMETGVTLLTTGLLTAVTRTRTVTWFGGFTGGARVLFSNEDGVAIGASEEMRFGVDGRWLGRSDRTETWTQNIDPALARQVKKLTIVHYWAPKVTVQQMIESAIQIGKDIVELIIELNAEPDTNTA